MKVFIVVDHVCEADINVAVFATKRGALKFIKEHKDDPYAPGLTASKYESLAIEAFELHP